MTYNQFTARLNPDNRYLIEERTAIKEDSGIDKETAEKQAMEEFKQEMERRDNK